MSDQLTPNSQPDEPSSGSNNQAITIGIVIALIIVAVLLFFLLSNRNGGDEAGAVPTFTATAAEVVATEPPPTEAVPTVPAEGGGEAPLIPTPRPGFPFFTVTSADGVNVRNGPGTEFAAVATLPQNSTGEVTAITNDGQWLQMIAPQATGGAGWIAAGLVTVSGLEQVPVLPPPDVEVTPTPTSEAAAPIVAFTADQTVIDAGECTTVRWQVQNVSEVYVYPAGADWADFPVTGEGSEEVCPEETTTYELRVVLPNGSADTRQISVQVIQPDAPADPLAGTTWTLAALNINQLPLPDSVITLGFSTDGVAAGNGGCNEYSGPYVVADTALTIGPVLATQQQCSEDLNAQETAYLAALETVSGYADAGGQLSLVDGSGQEVLRFNPGPALFDE
jgi:heat shock protein HslJ/uncharacterized protein YraI